MNRTDWQGWLERWLARHPVKSPPSFLQASYTEEVLRRIRETQPAPVFRWVLAPRFSLALATAACAVLLAVWANQAPDRMGIELAKVEELGEIEQMLDLLEEVDPDSFPALELDAGSEEDLLEELQKLDKAELASA